MNRKVRYFILIVFVLLAACFITFQITYSETDRFWSNRVTEMLYSGRTEIINDLSELTEVVSENCIKKVEQESASSKTLQGYMESVDRFSMYMDEEEYRDYLALQNSVSKMGIGVSTLYDSTIGGIYVVNVYKESPAELAGIVPGDVITHVGGVSVRELGYYTAMCQISMGEENMPVNVSIRKVTGEIVSKNIVRQQIKPFTITGEKMEYGIGLITIPGFGSGDDEVFKSVLEKLIVSGCEKFVLDVRNNAGGNIETISRILDFLLKDGELFTVTDKSGATNTVLSDTNSVPYPLAVLINEGTVGGAEIFAAALGNDERVSLFGTKTYGKATTQSVFALSTGGAVSVSTNIYTPKGGKTFEGVGVQPDAVVELTADQKGRFTTLQKSEDTPLQAAASYLQTQSVIPTDR